MSMDNVNRRDVLKGAATIGLISTAGCAGGGDTNGDGENGESETHTVTIGATSQNSSTQAAAQALARAANDHSDTVSISPQVTDGWTANLYEYDDENIPAMGVDNNSLSKALTEDGPFAEDPVDSLPLQGFMFTSLQIHWVALEGSGLESTADLEEGGYTIYPIQPGFGTRLLTEEVIKEADLWEQNEILNVDTGDIPGAVEEGRVDALCVYGGNGVQLSGWVQEVDVRSGGDLYLLEVDDNFKQAIQNVPGAIMEEFEVYGYEQDISKITDQVTSWSLAAQWAFSPDIPAAATKEIARIAHEHHDTIRESDPTTLNYDDPGVMTTTVIPDLEIHPGIAEFFQENDIWEEEWTSG